MLKKNKGSRPTSEMVDISEAADLLKVSERTIHNLCNRGLLRPHYLTRKGKKYFLIHDVVAVYDVHTKRHFNVSEVVTMALQANVRATVAEKKVADLLRLLGLDSEPLGSTEEEVVALYARAQDGVTEERDIDPEDLEEWVVLFQLIDEDYLGLVRKFTGDEEPWKVFMLLSKKYMEHPLEGFESDISLKRLYAHLQHAVRQLRQVAFFYCRNEFGRGPASRVFLEAGINPRTALEPFLRR